MRKHGALFVAGLVLSAGAAAFCKKPSVFKSEKEPVAAVEPSQSPSLRRFFLTPASFADLRGWEKDDLFEVLPALKNSCRVLKEKLQWKVFCADLKSSDFKTNAQIRDFLETKTLPFAVNNRAEGLFTGYYEPVINGSLRKTKRFGTPLWGVPSDIVKIDLGKFDPALKGNVVFGKKDGNEIKPYLTRKEIETGQSRFPAKAVAWVEHPVDAFILQIQGSGRLRLLDGKEISVGYAGNNGHKFVGIGSLMAKEGLLKQGVYTMSEIKDWLKKNPKDAERLMHANPRYIFFRILEENGVVGSMNVPLTAKRSLAVDPAYVPLGSILWLETADYEGALNRLTAAQDTGSAIKGPVRGDFFWGSGEKALKEAGKMRSKGVYYMLVPKEGINELKQKGIINDESAS